MKPRVFVVHETLDRNFGRTKNLKPMNKWTPEMVEYLKKLRRLGYSFSEITTAMWQHFPDAKLSRSAIIGKYDRLTKEKP